MGDWRIDELAQQSGVPVDTIRYYQRLGLMPTPARPHGSVRRYGKDAVDRLHFIKRAQGLGFSLDEVKMLLALAVGEHGGQILPELGDLLLAGGDEGLVVGAGHGLVAGHDGVDLGSERG